MKIRYNRYVCINTDILLQWQKEYTLSTITQIIPVVPPLPGPRHLGKGT